MSMFLCHAVVIKGTVGNSGAKSEMQTEMDLFEANGAELARQSRRQSRRQNIARLSQPVARTWARTLDLLTQASRAAQQRKDLLERMESMPSYMLRDIGVSRDQVGRFCYTNDYGMLVDLIPAAQETPATRPTAWVGGRELAYAAP